MENITKPPLLKTGDTVALVSPSAPMASVVEHRVQQAKINLENMGLEVIFTPNAFKRRDYTAGTPQERAEDLHYAFKNKNVKAIISFIGGFHSNQIVKHLDFDLIKQNPKIFMGFSDISVLHFALHTKGNLVTFYGPAAITQFGDKFGIHEYTLEYFKKAVMSDAPIGKIRPSTEWTDELLNWFAKADLERPRKMKPNHGYEWLREGSAKGKLIGGCITSILHMRGTEFWPCFKDSLFFWEIPESSCDISKGEPLAKVDAYLTDLELSGVFDQINGMLIGRPKGYTEDETTQLKEVVLEKIRDYSFPVLFKIDTGHTDPIATLPLGVDASLDSDANSFKIMESAVTS